MSDDVRKVLEYVSMGRGFVDVEPYPDAVARRALGSYDRLESQNQALQERAEWAEPFIAAEAKKRFGCCGPYPGQDGKCVHDRARALSPTQETDPE